MLRRPPSSPAMAMRNPSPSPASRFSAGTLQSAKIDLAGRLHMPAHLVLERAEGEAGRVLRHHQGRDAFRAVLAGAHHGHVDVAVARPGDELLGAVEHVVARRCRRSSSPASSAPPRPSPSPARSGSSSPAIPSRSAWAASRCRCSSLPNRSIIHDAMLWIEMKAANAGQASRQRLEHQHGVEPRQPGAADVVPHIDAAETERPGLADHLGRKMPALCPSRARCGATRSAAKASAMSRMARCSSLSSNWPGACFGGGVHGLLPDVFRLGAAVNLDQ